MKYSQNTSAFSIILALGLTLLLSLTGLYLLEYMIPFSRNIKGVENASKAFYESYSGLEDALYVLSKNEIGYGTGVVSSSFEYKITGTGTILPLIGEGNSQYTSNRNRISGQEPIQLLVGKGRISGGGTNQFVLQLRIPDLNNNNSYDEIFHSGTNDDIIFWQLSSNGDSISASGSLISEFNINGNTLTDYRIWTKNGVLLNGTQEDFGVFYNSNCNGSLDECVLKILVINPLISPGGGKIPYLEYRINTSKPIPLRFSRIKSDGNSYGFTKKLEVAIPQQSTNSAFDFTVFQ